MEEESPVTTALTGCLEFTRAINPQTQACPVADLRQLDGERFEVIRRCGRELHNNSGDEAVAIGVCMLNREVCILPNRFLPPLSES
jgi:hypothetical protein